MERKSLIPLVKEITKIVQKTGEAVRNPQLVTEGKAMFSEGAVERATRIGERMGNIQYTPEEGFEPGE